MVADEKIIVPMAIASLVALGLLARYGRRTGYRRFRIFCVAGIFGPIFLIGGVLALRDTLTPAFIVFAALTVLCVAVMLATLSSTNQVLTDAFRRR